jgi:septal ring-binding cell division protein DamX
MAYQASTNPGARQQSGPSPSKKRRWPFLIGGLFILLQGCATTPSVSPGEEARIQAKIAYLLSDYQRTLVIVLPRAEAGEPWAQYTLGYLYYYGRGVAQDRQTAKRWIESAAAKGYAPAQQAMKRLSAPPRTGNENNDTSKQESGAVPENKEPIPAPVTTQPTPESSVLPAEPPKPINPQMTAPSSTPTPTTPPPTQDTPPAPRNEPERPPDSSPPADPMPPQTSAPSSSTEAADQAPAPAPPDNGIKGRDWISKQDPRHFTLQLASSVDETKIIHLIRKQRIERHAAYYSTRQNGRTWYSLVYGSFPNRSAAHQAMGKLPRVLRRNSPRIRSFRDIHAQLNPAP